MVAFKPDIFCTYLFVCLTPLKKVAKCGTHLASSSVVVVYGANFLNCNTFHCLVLPSTLITEHTSKPTIYYTCIDIWVPIMVTTRQNNPLLPKSASSYTDMRA